MNTQISTNDGAQSVGVFASKDLLGKIACADALEVLREMPDNSVDFVFTDPPYKVSADYGNNLDADNLLGVAGVLRIFPELARAAIAKGEI